ncbi:MAG: hypothetical protein ACQEXB_01215 [Bacillota bacterium]
MEDKKKNAYKVLIYEANFWEIMNVIDKEFGLNPYRQLFESTLAKDR